LIFSETVHDRYVFTLDIPRQLEAETKSAQPVSQRVRKPAVEESDDRHRGLLCADDERQRRRAGKSCNEGAPGHAFSSRVGCEIVAAFSDHVSFSPGKADIPARSASMRNGLL